MTHHPPSKELPVASGATPALCDDCRKRLRSTQNGLFIATPAASSAAAATGPPRIFLSYARSDRAAVEPIYTRLANAGFRPWMDVADLLPGEVWAAAIERELRRADFFIACLSESSVHRRGMLQGELKTALEIFRHLLDSDIYLIPLRLTPCSVPPPLDRWQYLDLFSDDWWPRLEEAIAEGWRRRRAGAEPFLSAPQTGQPAACRRCGRGRLARCAMN